MKKQKNNDWDIPRKDLIQLYFYRAGIYRILVGYNPKEHVMEQFFFLADKSVNHPIFITKGEYIEYLEKI